MLDVENSGVPLLWSGQGWGQGEDSQTRHHQQQQQDPHYGGGGVWVNLRKVKAVKIWARHGIVMVEDISAETLHIGQYLTHIQEMDRV